MNSLKILLKIGFTGILAYLFQTMFPWWSCAVASLLISLIISTNSYSSFMAGFLGVALLWLFAATIIDLQTNSILTERVATIFSLPSNFLLILVTSLIGGITGGFSALTGYYLRNWIMPPVD